MKEGGQILPILRRRRLWTAPTGNMHDFSWVKVSARLNSPNGFIKTTKLKIARFVADDFSSVLTSPSPRRMPPRRIAAYPSKYVRCLGSLASNLQVAPLRQCHSFGVFQHPGGVAAASTGGVRRTVVGVRRPAPHRRLACLVELSRAAAFYSVL